MKEHEAEQWRQADRLFQELSGVSAEARAMLLGEAEPAIRTKVESLLAADELSNGLLDKPLDSVLALLADGASASGSALEGRQIGRWILEEEIGRGGSAVVYRAHRADGSVDQQVALKLLTLALLGRDGASRFEHEQQVLARLRHPDIATLIDGGTAEDGTPFLVTELVDGRRLDLFCDEEGLSLQDRVRLFLSVCNAVAFAHRNLVVHRDLKPNNILVDGDGRVRLLDFGIAKLLDAGEATQTLRMLTPGYAAPEQLAGEPITTATDVFGLGIVLYKLLAGVVPEGFESRSPAGEPGGPVRPPSAVATKLATNLATKMRVDPDLDAIVLKATRVEPERRYVSAQELADDLGRWLDGRPVVAGPDRATYRLRKFVGRHRLTVVASCLAIFGLIGGSALALWQAGVARQESVRARRAQSEAESVTAFLVDTFEAADPLGTRGGDVSAREIVQAGVERIDQELTDQPLDRQRLLMVLGEVSLNLGDFDQASELFAAALAGPDMEPEQLVEALRRAAEASSQGGDYPAAEELFQQAINTADASQGGERIGLELAFASYLTNSYQNARAEERVRSLLAAEWFQASAGPLDRSDAATILAVALNGLGRLEESREWAQRGIDLVPDNEETAGPRRAAALSLLAGIEQELGNLDRAEDLERQAFEIYVAIYGEAHLLSLGSQNNLATLLKMKGQFGESAALLQQVIAVQEGALGEMHPHLAVSWFNLAEAQLLNGDLESALNGYRQAIAVAEASLSAGNPRIGVYYGIYGRALSHAGQVSRAAEAFGTGLGLLYVSPGAEHPLTARVNVEYAAFLNDQERFVEAQEIVAVAMPLIEAAYTADSREYALALLQQGRALAEGRRALEETSQAIRALRESHDILARSAHRARYVREIGEAEKLLARLGE